MKAHRHEAVSPFVKQSQRRVAPLLRIPIRRDQEAVKEAGRGGSRGPRGPVPGPGRAGPVAVR
eukprot:16445904-Heterocapsa_arctica.AAC.1